MSLRSLSFAPLVLAVVLALPTASHAASKRDQAAIDTLNQRMQAAETRYRNGLVAASNADPEATRETDAALEDMEDVLAACQKQRGCSITPMLATYKRLLKANVDAEAADDDEDEGELVDDHTPVTGTVPEAARAAQLLSDDHRFDSMVQYNPAVQAGIRRWLTDMRPALIDSYENYQYMRHLMWPQYQRANLPEALLFGIMAKESNGKVHVGSRAGAVGPLQFMPATGRRFGLGDDGTGFDTRYDPRSAAEASASYLNERMRELNRSIEMALAAYNGGEGRALRVYNSAGGRTFWDESVYNQFPAETKDYVPMVIAAAWLFLHPREYGLRFPKVDVKPVPLRLTQPASIYQLTICLGNGGTRDGFMRALRNLNPRYEADSYLPAGTSINATQKISTLYGRYCTAGKRADLAKTLVNSSVSNAIVRTGPPTPVVDTAVASQPLPVAGGTSPAPMPAPKAKPAPRKPAAPKEYRVQTGETLTSIASKFRCSVEDLAEANKVSKPRYAIKPGQRLKLEGCDG